MLQWKSMENGLVVCDLKTEKQWDMHYPDKIGPNSQNGAGMGFYRYTCIPNIQKARTASKKYAAVHKYSNL